MSDISESTYPESTAGPTSPIFGTASFSTFTTTALTSLWPPSSRQNSRPGSSCGSENEQSELGTYQDDQSVTETEGAGIALVADEVSNLDDDDDESEVSAERNSQLSTDDTLSSSYHIQTTSAEYTRTPTRSSVHSYIETGTPVYSNPYLTSSSEQLTGTLSRTTLTPTYTGTPPRTHSRSYTTSSISTHSGYSQRFPPALPPPPKRTAGQLIAFYEQQAHSRAASAPMEVGQSRPSSPTKPASQSQSVPVGMPGALPTSRSDGPSWRSSGSAKTLSSWSFGSERSRSPVKSTSESGSAVSGSVLSGSSGYTRSGSTRSGYAGGLIGALGGLVGFSSSSSSSRVSTASRSPSRRGPEPTTPRRRERTVSSPRSAFSQVRRSPRRGKDRESPRSSPSPTRSAPKSDDSGADSASEVSAAPATTIPPLDVAEYGGSGEPVNAAPVWYYNVHRLPPYTWNYAEGYLFPNMMLLSWVAPTGGRVVVKLDLLSCVEIRTSRPQGASDITVEREGGSHRLQTFELGYGDSIERLGCETRVEMLDWFNSIQTVFNGIMSMTESERAHGRPASPAVTISSFDFSESVISSQLRSAPASQSLSGYRARPRTPTVPLTEGVLRSSTPPIDTTVNNWRVQALERSTTSSDVSSVVEDVESPSVQQHPVAAITHSQPSHSQGSYSQNPQSLHTRTYAPSLTSQTMTYSLSSGTLYGGARTLMEIGSSTGTDIVASTLSFRGTASASLLGDSCAPTTIETASTVFGTRDRHYHRFAPSSAAHQASGSGYEAEVEETQQEHAPMGMQQASADAFGGGRMNQSSHIPQDEMMDSPATQASDSDYVTASSPSASFVSLSGISAFPDDEEEEEVGDESFLPEPIPEDATVAVEPPPTPIVVSEVDAETIKADDDTSTVAFADQEQNRHDGSKSSGGSTPIVATHDLEEPPVQTVVVADEPEVASPPVVLRVDACTQADIEELAKDDTPQPELVPLPNPADTVYSPSVKSVGISPMPFVAPLEPEIVPQSPQSEVLSTLSGAVPELSQLPKAATSDLKEDVSETAPDIVAQSPMPSLTSEGLSDPTRVPSPEPSVIESLWPVETDHSYESSVLNASPSLRSELRIATDYGAVQSPTVSDARTPTSIVKAQSTVLSVAALEEDASSISVSETDSADDVSTPTASSWVSTLPPSVPSNTLNDTESMVQISSEVSRAKSVELASAIFEASTAHHESPESKTFADEGCQAELSIDNGKMSPRLVPLPISRPPSRHSVSISALPETAESGSLVDIDLQVDILADRLSGLESKLSFTYSQGSDKIIDHLVGMGETMNKDNTELRNMLIELLESSRSQDALAQSRHVDQGISAESVMEPMPEAVPKVDMATSPILVAMIDCSTSPPPVLLKEQMTSPILMTKYRDMNAGQSPRHRPLVNSILLTPPPRDAASPDTLLETMSYLSSHHSDDLSVMDLEFVQDSLQVDRVSPSLGSDSSSAHSERLSEYCLTEPGDVEVTVRRSANMSPSQLSSASMEREDGSMADDDEDHEMSTIAPGSLLRLPSVNLAPSQTGSTRRTASVVQTAAIQMPIPTRAGLPFAGQLASLIASEQQHVDQYVSARYSDVAPTYFNQATSPVPELQDAMPPPELKPTLVDREVDGAVPDILDAVHEEKSVDAMTQVSEVTQGKSADAIAKELAVVSEDKSVAAMTEELEVAREEKSVIAVADEPESAHEEKSVIAIAEEQHIAREEKYVDATIEEVETVHEEKSVDPIVQEPETISEEKAVGAIADAGLVYEEKSVCAATEEPDIAHHEVSVEANAMDLEITHEEKSVGAMDEESEILRVEKFVDAILECGDGDALYGEKSTGPAGSPATRIDVISSHELPSILAKDVETQHIDAIEALEARATKQAFIENGFPPPITVLPMFLQDEPAFSARVRDIVTTGLSPALENVALLVQENRMVRDEFKQAHEGYRQAHEETVIRIGEMYRMAQDEIMNSLAQMKALVSQIMANQTPVQGAVPMPQPQVYSTPLGFVPHAVPSPIAMPMPTAYPNVDQSMLFPSPQVAHAVQSPVFAPTPSHMSMAPPLPTAIITTREVPVIPSPPLMSPTLTESSVDSDVTPTIATVPIPPVQHHAATPSVLQESMVPLPPSPMFLSPQPLNFPISTSAQHMTRDLPTMPEMVPEESQIIVQPPLAVHASEYTPKSRDIPNEEVIELSAAPPTETPSTPATVIAATVPEVVLEEPLVNVVVENVTAPEDTAEGEDQHVPNLSTEESTLDEVVTDPATEALDMQDRSIIDFPDVPQETAIEVDDGKSEASEMSGLTTPSRPSTPAEQPVSSPKLDATTDDDGATRSDASAVHDNSQTPEHSSQSEPEARSAAAEAREHHSSSLVEDIRTSIATAAADLKMVVEAARNATEGAFAASRDAQAMLESVRAQREEVTRQLEECTREREAAKADRDEAEILRQRTLTEAASERERDVVERDARISELQQELDVIRAREHELELSQVNALAERDSRLTALQEELDTVMAREVEQEASQASTNSEREGRISELQMELDTSKARESELEALHATVLSERDAKIQILEDELGTVRSDLKKEKEARDAEKAERIIQDEERDRAHAEANAERDSRISTLEEELASLRTTLEEERLVRTTQDEEHEKALVEATSERERETSERDTRIQTLEQELLSIRLEHEEAQRRRETEDVERNEAVAEREKTFIDAVAERDDRIQSLEEELVALRDETVREREEQQTTISKLEEAQQASDAVHADGMAEHQRSIEARDERIAALEKEISQIRSDHEADLQRRIGEEEELKAAWTEKEQALTEASAERDARIQALELQLAEVQAEHEQKQQQRDAEETEAHAAWDERERALQEAAADRDTRISALEDELVTLRAEREQEKEQHSIEEAARSQREYDITEAALERERLSSERQDSRLKELTDELAALRAERELERQHRMTEDAERREADRAEVRELADAQTVRLSGIQEKLDLLHENSTERLGAIDTRLDKISEESGEQFAAVDSKLEKLAEESGERFTNVDARFDKLAEESAEQFANIDTRFDKLAEISTGQFQSVETRFANVEQVSIERFANVDTQLEKMVESSGERFITLEARLTKIDEDAVKDREQHEQELVEAASKPTVESLFEQHMAVLKAQVQEQIDALENDMKIEGSRQHEEIIANVRGTIEEQAALLVTTCLDELGKLLESIGAQQQAELLSAMRVTIQEQVTFNISYYLEELTKMFDAHGVRHLSETIEAVRATAREQVPYNTEEHLTDFCKNLAPEMLQLFQEIKEKAEEKSRLDRQIDILRRHKHDYETGDLRGEDFADPPPIHVSRSDADLRKAWRGRSRPAQRGDSVTDMPYTQTGSHHSIYPDQWSHDGFDQNPMGEVALLPPGHDAPMMSSRSPNASFYRA